MLSIDGNADAAVETRARKGWNKLRHLAPEVTNKDDSLLKEWKWDVIQKLCAKLCVTWQ